MFSEVIKWFNVENDTSFAPSSSELIFGLNSERKNQSSSDIVKKLDFTLLFAKYYMYINKLAPKDLTLDEFKAKISWGMISKNPLLQFVSKNPTYRNTLYVATLTKSNTVLNVFLSYFWKPFLTCIVKKVLSRVKRVFLMYFSTAFKGVLTYLKRY